MQQSTRGLPSVSLHVSCPSLPVALSKVAEFFKKLMSWFLKILVRTCTKCRGTWPLLATMSKEATRVEGMCVRTLAHVPAKFSSRILNKVREMHMAFSCLPLFRESPKSEVCGFVCDGKYEYRVQGLRCS